MPKHHIHKISFLVFAALGAILAYVLLLNHFSILTSICDAGPRINCDIVNQSLYSTILSIPVALVGMLGYSFLFLLAAANIFFKKRYFAQIIFMLSLGGALFSAYLTGVEAFVLGTFCLYCLTSQSIIILLSIFSYHSWKNSYPQMLDRFKNGTMS